MTTSCYCCPDASVKNPKSLPAEKNPMYDHVPVFSEEKHLDLKHPERVLNLIDNFNNDPKFVSQLPSSFGGTTPFKVLNEVGMDLVANEIDYFSKYAVSCPRIPRVNRGLTFRSSFLNDLGHSPAILAHVSALAGCELIYHPMKIQQLHINMNPLVEDGELKVSAKKKIDRWHCDTTGFVLILFCTDRSKYDGGNLQYFAGTREEGVEYFRAQAASQAVNDLDLCSKEVDNRIVSVGDGQQRGYGVFMQGSRVYHQVTPVTRGTERTTAVFSFHPMNVLALEACTLLGQTYNEVDPLDTFIPDWVRHRAYKIARRMELWLDYQKIYLKNISEDGKCECVASTNPNCNSFKNCNIEKAVITCRDNMYRLNKTVPYTDDRKLLVSLLNAAVEPLKAFAKDLELVEDGNANVFNIHMQTANNDCAVCGNMNLANALKEIDSCNNDVMTIGIDNSVKMEYF